MKHKIERHLGRRPSKVEVSLKLTNYVDVTYVLPKIPPNFGHRAAVPASGWGMALNDKLGDCVIAGAFHEHRLWNAVNGRRFDFTDAQVLKTYETIAGYDPKDPSTDQGTDMQAAASARRKVGIPDALGKRHKIDAYIALEPGNFDQLRVAMYLFGAAGIGMLFPDACWDQYKAGKPWDATRRPNTTEGHYIPGMGVHTSVIDTVTWGGGQGMTKRGYQHLVDEALAYYSREYLGATGKTPEGFDEAALLADLKLVTAKSPHPA